MFSLGYGKIYRGKWRETTVAIKMFKIDHSNENTLKDFLSECHAMEALRHPNIVMFLGACTLKPNFSILLEFCKNGVNKCKFFFFFYREFIIYSINLIYFII